jgi:hypothetical protein
MDEQEYYFTWGFGQGHDNCFIKIYGTYDSARAEMARRFGTKWAFQYGESGWFKDGISQQQRYGLTEIH